MKSKKVFFIPLFVALFIWRQAPAQTNGYIYVHLKSINEQNSTDFPFVLRNSSGTTINSFSLNDQATDDNNSSSTNYFSTLDLGLSHGTGGDGQLWALEYSNAIENENTGVAGTVYVRAPGSSQWTVTNVTTAIAIDGAYANQFVYANGSGNVYFYNNGTSTQIYTGANATDVTANGGRIAIVAGGIIKLYSAGYAVGSAPNTTGATWTALQTVNTTTRLDMNLGATSIAFVLGGTNTVKTVTLSNVVATLASPGGSVGHYGTDIAYDDAGYIYTVADDASANDMHVFDYNGSAWNEEAQARDILNITGGAAHMVFGANVEDEFSVANIFSRQTDNLGNIYWIDDDRVKSTSALNGNGIVIPVTPGTYTLTETLPSTTTYDLGRYNIYDPGGSSTGNVNTQVITFVVTANEVVFGEYVNESLVPKAINLSCTFQYLQTFDATTSTPVKTYTYGNGAHGTPLEGTAYHYSSITIGTSTPITRWDDGYYELYSSLPWQGMTFTDHTGNGGYFMAINASYAKDEFYRQRVTNLVPGLSYTISFWAVDLSYESTLPASLTYGLQDSLGNIVNQAATGIISSPTWAQYSFTFTATTSRADLFLTNAEIGGSGNDLGIDDIAINPVLPTLAASTGSKMECVGSSYNFSNGQSGGLWTTSNSAVASVNANSGSVRAKGAGTAIISYTYTNQIGCLASTSDTVTITAPPVVTATDKYNGTTCLNQTDSLYTNFTTTSTAPYTYAWVVYPSSGDALSSTATQNTSATATSSGSYTFVTTVTDALGCSATASAAVNVSGNTAPTVAATATITSAACVNPTALNLTGGISGSLNPNYTYVWSGPGTIANPNSGSISATNYNTTATSTVAGSYTLTVTDGNGCIGTATTATAAPGQLSITTGVYSASECNNTKDSLYSVAGGGTAPYTYQWTATTAPGTVTYSPGSTKDTTGVSFGTAGTYKFTVKATDKNSCTVTSPTVQIAYVNTAGPTVTGLNTAATTCAGNTISLTSSPSGGTGSYSYLWAASPATGSGLVATNTKNTAAAPTAAGGYVYTVKVTDGNNCSISASTGTQTVNTALTVAAVSQNPDFCGTTGTDQLFAIASGGSGTYSTYTWSGVLSGGSGSTSLSSTSTADPVASISGTATGSTFKYTVQVTDNGGCTATASTTDIVVAGAPALSSVTATPNSTCATNTTSIALSGTFSGGTSPYSYAWTAPTNSTVTTQSGTATASPITATATATAAQNYEYAITIQDANNCAATGSSTVFALNSGPAITLAASNYSVCANPATAINLYGVFTTAGTTPYTYKWTASAGTSGGVVNKTTNDTTTATPQASGTYTLQVTDAVGCTATATTPTVAVDQAMPSISLTCGTNANGINYAQLSENSGIATSWLWTTTGGGSFYPNNTLSPNNNTSTSTSQVTYINYNGTYAVAITDANGCSGSGSTILNSGSCNVILAASNLNFTVEKQENTAVLGWSTTSETNNSYFEIERSADGTTWQVIGTVQGQGNSAVLSKYSFTDPLPLVGANYYRLKQVDVNGQYSYSPVKYLVFTGQWLVKLYPNPVQNYLVLEFNNDKNEKANIVIQSVLGNAVFATEQQLVTGLNRVTLNGVQQLAAGTYVMVMSTNENTFRSKFVKGGN